MKDSFVIYTKYEEQISLLTDTQAGILLRALMKYQSGKELPKMDAVTSLAFSFIKQQIDFDNQKYEEICEARKSAGALGGRPSKTLETKGEKPKKPNGFEEKAKKPNGFSEKQTKAKKPESDNDNDTDIYPPPFYSPPNGGEKEKTDEDLFFQKYPRYAKDREKMRMDVDYKRLIEEFEKSTYLRSLYTVKQINDNYVLIVSGEFRDKEKKDPHAEKFAEINAKAERDRWYAARKNKAENAAESIRERFMQLDEFRTIERRLSAMQFEMAENEVKAEKGDNKAVKQLVKLEQEQNRLIMQRRNIIEFNGKTEEDLLPKWHCKKCSDTGYLPDGKLCDCYKKESGD